MRFEVVDGSGIFIGGKEDPLLIIAGPCVIESEDLCLKVADFVKNLTEKMGFNYMFKASYDKANRSSVKSFRGPGIDKGLEILIKVKEKIGIPVLTDVHTPEEAKKAGEVVDVVQIPAFLCRQTDILVEAGKSGKTVNIKKGQFMAPEQMKNAVEKVKSTGNDRVLLTERGTFFGYGDLVNDFRSLVIMRQFAPVIYDATHSVQKPGGAGDRSGGDRRFIPYLTRGAVAVGVDGVFMEVHPEPEKGLSDPDTMLPLDEIENLLKQIKSVREAVWSVK